MNLNFEWERIGSVKIVDEAELVFPKAPAGPGVYRFTADRQVYIGESSNLLRRFAGFRSPGGRLDTKVPRTNRRVNKWLLGVLGTSAAIDVSVEICVGSSIESDRISLRSVDFEFHSGRLLVENAAITEARLRGYELINL